MGEDFQTRVANWLYACFGTGIAGDVVERRHRFIEESLELLQATGGTKEEALLLVEYVFGRPKGDRMQEIGGVMLTLSALCSALGINMEEAGDVELSRVWTKIEAIRAKQATKPKGSVLPQ